MKNLTHNLKSRISSDRADSLTVSQMLWITFAVVLVIGVGTLVYNAIMAKSQQVADCINNSNIIFKGSGSNANCGTP